MSARDLRAICEVAERRWVAAIIREKEAKGDAAAAAAVPALGAGAACVAGGHRRRARGRAGGGAAARRDGARAAAVHAAIGAGRVHGVTARCESHSTKIIPTS